MNDTQSGSVGTDTSTQGNGDVYVDTPNNNDNNNNYAPDAPQPNNTSSEEQSSAADSSSQVEDDVFHYIWNSRELDDGGVELVFYNGNDTNVTIPNTIGGRAFPHGTHIELEEGNTSLALYDDGSLYSSDGKKLMYVCPEDSDYRFPDGVEEIGENAFSHCRLLQYVTMTDNVTYLGGYTFANCPRLTYIRLSNNIQILFEGTLCYTAIPSITLPKKLGIMEGVLIDSRVESVNLPDTLQYIQEGRYLGANADMKIAGAGGPGQGAAFWICNDLRRVAIPENLVFIHYVAFLTIPQDGEQSIKNVYHKGTKEQWKKIKRSNDDYEHKDNLADAKMLHSQ